MKILVALTYLPTGEVEDLKYTLSDLAILKESGKFSFEVIT